MPGDLWQFSLAFYSRPGVAPACLCCQDETGTDVNMILFLLWQAGDGVSLRQDEVAAIDHDVRSWRELVVQALRGVRRHLKALDTAATEALRSAVKSAELEAEQLQQQQLSHYARGHEAAPALDAAISNLDAYQAATGRVLPPGAVSALLDAFANRPTNPTEGAIHG